MTEIEERCLRVIEKELFTGDHINFHDLKSYVIEDEHDLVMIAMELEDEFDIHIRDEDLDCVVTVDDMINVVKTTLHLKAQEKRDR